MSIEVGDQAPDFELRNQHGQRVRLSSYRGKKAVLLVFYPWAFSGTCSGELHELQENLGELQRDDVAVLTVSIDSMYALRTWADRDGFTFELLADSWPHGAVARSYGVFSEEAGAAIRGSFVIDKAGVVRWSVVNGIGEARSLDDYAKALASL